MRAILGCGLAVVLALAASAPADDKADKIDGTKLVGKWEPKDVKKDAAVTVEFAKGDKLTISMTFAGKTEKIAGSYKLAGDKLTVTMADGGKDRTETMTVLKLTDAELTTKDPKGKEETMKRVADKK